ncbi:MAG: o-succinylbenzoate--CoA ligase [Ignavibacteriaceae bacterium]|jgi:O-succinylbenzoic acid--CoA ligase|nr:o-succinylbenzoate--CoA ligase [Ignavibacteriaceae bacterium]
MKLKEFSITPFTHFNNFNKNNFLFVHHSLVDKSELFDFSVLGAVERLGDFFIFTYKQVSDITKIITGEMLAEGLVNQKLVPILMSNPFDLMLSVISLWRNNAVPVPLNIHLLKNDLEEQINFLKIENILCETNFVNDFPSQKKFSFSNIPLTNSILSTGFQASDTTVLLFTSGTSGKPKAVPLTFDNLFAAFNAGYSIFNYSEDDSWYLNLPLYHIGGFSILVRAILAGSSIILPESNELDSLKINLEIVKPTLISLVPTQLKRICENGIRPNKELHAALIGGGFSDETILTQAANLGWNIYKVYGSTETSAFITALTPDEIFQKPKSIGKPLKNVEIKIFDKQRNILPANEVGEIGIKAPSIFRSYLDNKTDSDAAFYNRYYLTGDYGFYDTDGYLYLENRRTDLIVSGGENISPNEIENIISKFPNIDEVCVFGLPDKEWGEIVAAVIITKNKSEINFSELRIFLKEKLSSFKVPKKYFQVEELPKSAIGKIKRSEVKRIFISSHT